MKRRPGITLIEVLVAIFIMAIGLLALLTLFPLGALRMSQALQNDRTASCASAGANICDAFGVRTDPQYDPAGQPSLFVTPPSPGFQFAAQNGGGIPIYIDPYGVANGSGPLGGPASDLTAPTPATPGITRLASNVIPGAIAEPTGAASQAARYFTLLDDMTFLDNGLPDTGGSAILQRGDRYTWAYLLHRSPPSSTSGAAAVDLQIVVYAGRSTAVASGEATYAAQGGTQQTSVTLTHPAGSPPNIHRGSWILDTSYDDATTIVPTFSVHGDFYRVISISTIDNQHVNLELQDPISKPTGISAITVMDNVVEVFKRATYPSNVWEFRTQSP
jgi:prepilin-type N-terminal cleavage/methylation domain-containing protein